MAATIPLSSMGQIHHTIRRHRSTTAGRQMSIKAEARRISTPKRLNQHCHVEKPRLGGRSQFGASQAQAYTAWSAKQLPRLIDSQLSYIYTKILSYGFSVGNSMFCLFPMLCLWTHSHVLCRSKKWRSSFRLESYQLVLSAACLMFHSRLSRERKVFCSFAFIDFANRVRARKGENIRVDLLDFLLLCQ